MKTQIPPEESIQNRLSKIHHKLRMQASGIETLSTLLINSNDPSGLDILLDNLALGMREPLDDLEKISDNLGRGGVA